MQQDMNRITAKVQLHNYRFPRTRAHRSGEYAIVLLEVIKTLEGDLNVQAVNSNGCIIVTGIMPKLEPGVEYKFTGSLVFDKKWGYQYECENIVMNYNLTSIADQKKFLSFILTESQIDSLYQEYNNPIELLDAKNIGALTKVKGIGPATALRMCNKYSENADNSRAYVELKEYNLSKAAIMSLIKNLGSADTVCDVINENPYNLIKLVRGYGWEKADRIARAKGFTTDCKERCLAFTQYRLEQIAEEGNSRVNIVELLNEIMTTCYPVTKENLKIYIKEKMVGQSDFESVYQKIINKEKIEDMPLLYYSKDTQFTGLLKLKVVERKIADELQRLNNAECNTQFDEKICEQIIQECEEEQGYKYTDEQKKAIWNCINNNVSILTGPSGSGKTSTLKPLIKIFNHYKCRVSQTALSGRAASLLTEVTGLEGKTIHRLLRYDPIEEKFSYDKEHPLRTDIIILDEVSMVGEELFLNLIEAISNGAKLFMVGDIKQLPPISVGNILGDCIKSGYISISMLTVIQRQAMKSGIISQSVMINNGIPLVKPDFVGEEIRGELNDFKIICHTDNNIVHKSAIDEFKRMIKEEHINPDDIQIIVPVRTRGVNSCRYFNAEIQDMVNKNPKGIDVEIIENNNKYTITYRPGDRVMVIKNNYHAMTVTGEETAIFNGNIGHIKDIDKESMIIEFDAIQETVIIERDSWKDITHAYAITCHKCVTGDTLIYTNKGIKTIKELDNGALPGEQRRLNTDIKVFNGIDYEQPSHFYNAGESEILKIRTKYNYELKCTLDHKIKIRRGTEELFVEASEVKVQDKVFIPINFNSDTQEFLPAEWQDTNLNVRAKRYTRPTKMTEDFALFLGMMVADGTLRRRGFHYYKRNLKTVQLFNELLFKLFGYKGTIRKHGKNTNAWGIECSSCDISQFLLNIDGLKPHDKHIPNCIFLSDKKYQLKFLQGFFEDGGVHMKNDNFDMIELSCKSENCAKEIRALLLQNGIVSSKYNYYKNRISKKTGKILDIYKIMIYSHSALEFKNKIGFLDEEKNNRLNLVLQNPTLSHNKDEVIIENDTQYILLPITEITTGYEQTYCLTMPKTHQFVQNGIIGSNCQGSQFPYVIVAVDMGSYPLLMREWLYTAITRGRKWCTLIGQNKAINTCVRTSNIKTKQTWLKDELYQKYLNSIEENGDGFNG